MYINIGFCQFQDAFHNMDRKDNFSYNGLRTLYDYLEQLEEDTGETIELDVIALCCEYSEIDEDDKEYSEYVGDDAEREEFIIATLPCGILVREG